MITKQEADWAMYCNESQNQGDRNFYTRFYVPEKCV